MKTYIDQCSEMERDFFDRLDDPAFRLCNFGPRGGFEVDHLPLGTQVTDAHGNVVARKREFDYEVNP